MPDKNQPNRLPRNFHKTFKPERQYINAMLRFAASGREGDYQTIAAATGIPMGASSGKVPAILDYCLGMGLIRIREPNRSAVKKPELTPFGRIVLLEDPYLREGVSQWIAHLNLCGPLTGADVWYQTFFSGIQALGMSFERTRLESHLSLIYGAAGAGLIGPLIRMYEDDAAFLACGVLSEISGHVTRKPAPLEDEFGVAYGAWMLQLLHDHFPNTGQVPITDLEAQAGWRTIPGWDIDSHQRILRSIERKGLIDVDRHMEPWLIRPVSSVEEAWKKIYSDLM
ncbi:MAG: hypothetical protein ACE15F_21580 [bacterium]